VTSFRLRCLQLTQIIETLPKKGSKLVQGNLSLFLYSNCWKEAISSELEAVVYAKLTSALMLCKYGKNPSLFLAQDNLLNFA
jgi:hypothetical protein